MLQTDLSLLNPPIFQEQAVQCGDSSLDKQNFFLENNHCNDNEPSITTTPPCPDTSPGPFVEHDNCCNQEIIPVCPSSLEPLTSSNINELSDLDYQPSETSEDCESEEEVNLESEMVECKKYRVFESELKKLFSFCQSCASPVNDLSTRTMGSMVVFTYSCINGHSFNWNSQPLINEISAGNLIISSAILLSGNTFSSMEESTGWIVDFQLLQVSEVTSSNAMEPEGCKRSLNFLIDSGVPIRSLSTDRLVTVSSNIKKLYPRIKHQFDTWHLAKWVI